MEHLAVADQPVDMRFGEKIGARHHDQYLGALHIEREFHVYPGGILHVLLQALEGIAQRPLGKPQVIADRVDLADNFI